MPSICRNFALLIATHFALSAMCTAQTVHAGIDSIVQHSLSHFDVVGSAVLVVHEGAVLHAQGYGHTSVNGGAAVDHHSSFGIASLSKAFTTAALAILVDEGKLHWNDRVKQYIPEFRMYNDYVTEHFIITDLLTHRSGLGLGVGDLMFFPDGGDFSIADVLGSFQHFSPASDFRTKYDYDNLLYIVAGEVIARVSGMGYEDFVAERIFAPLGMHDAYAVVGAQSHEGGQGLLGKMGITAQPHDIKSGDEPVALPALIHGVNCAAGGIHASISDMAAWVQLQLAKGRYGDGKELFSKKQHDEMWRIHTVKNTQGSERYRSHFAGYGLGWELYDLDGYLVVEHTGGLPGMLSKVMLLPDLELGIVVLSNTSPGGYGLFSSVCQSIADVYMGKEAFDWAAHYARRIKSRQESGDQVSEEVWREVEKSASIHVDASRYLGKYEDPWFGAMEVSMIDDQLWIRSLRSPKLSGPMQLYRKTAAEAKGNSEQDSEAHTFAISWEYQDQNCDAFATFYFEQGDKASRIAMKGISPNIDFSFDFHDLRLERMEE